MTGGKQTTTIGTGSHDAGIADGNKNKNANKYARFLVRTPRQHSGRSILGCSYPISQDVDQSEIFKKYIETPLRKHGAVYMFFGAQWNVLVHRPSFLREIFKHEDLYQKSGNQKKIPQSVLAEFLGDNIISSHGKVWRQYKSVIKPGIQNSRDIRVLSSAKNAGIAVQELLQRYTIAVTGEALFQADLHTLDARDARIHTLQMAVKKEIFKPIYMNFPFFDRFPISSRLIARRMCPKRPGSRLLAAREAGVLSKKKLLDNLTVTFVASQENPQLALISTLYLLAKSPNFIPKDTYLGYNCYSTNRDPKTWVPTANEFLPGRWGTTTEEISKQYRERRAKAEFISFHGGRRACLGDALAMLEIRMTFFALVREFQWSLDPTWVNYKTLAGPLYPRAWRLVFKDRTEGSTV
ncbi:cytochrome P450 [Podospora didyma]|uniref:Cytochrome P450 n=1 Tax=Podospora didyma TaxID=330526 RepID=A0AAE0NQH4_9PEZI|nr:cytochrome P450 [Podospora didyma]